MILINSTDEDPSTNTVVRWLLKFKVPFIRLNNKAEITNYEYKNDSFNIIANKKEINLSQVSAYWYRRGEFRIPIKVPKVSFAFNTAYRDYINGEMASLKHFLADYLKEKVFSIGDSLSCINVNKHIVLNKAKHHGLNIPDYTITCKRKTLQCFYNVHLSIVTKPLHNPFYYSNDSDWYPTYTTELTPEVIQELPETFAPTLLQKKIEKKFEVRSFFLMDVFYTMAIFSQNDDQTKTDFRNYNKEKPNRTVPFKLPEEVEVKLRNLMFDLGFESGSIDLIYDKNNSFYFLEVNPVGQFGMTSIPCNYFLEEKLALRLINPM